MGDNLSEDTLRGRVPTQVVVGRDPRKVPGTPLCTRPEAVLPLPQDQPHREGLCGRVASVRPVLRVSQEPGVLGEGVGLNAYATQSQYMNSRGERVLLGMGI